MAEYRGENEEMNIHRLNVRIDQVQMSPAVNIFFASTNKLIKLRKYLQPLNAVKTYWNHYFLDALASLELVVGLTNP